MTQWETTWVIMPLLILTHKKQKKKSDYDFSVKPKKPHVVRVTKNQAGQIFLSTQHSAVGRTISLVPNGSLFVSWELPSSCLAANWLTDKGTMSMAIIRYGSAVNFPNIFSRNLKDSKKIVTVLNGQTTRGDMSFVAPKVK